MSADKTAKEQPQFFAVALNAQRIFIIPYPSLHEAEWEMGELRNCTNQKVGVGMLNPFINQTLDDAAQEIARHWGIEVPIIQIVPPQDTPVIPALLHSPLLREEALPRKTCGGLLEN